MTQDNKMKAKWFIIFLQNTEAILSLVLAHYFPNFEAQTNKQINAREKNNKMTAIS